MKLKYISLINTIILILTANTALAKDYAIDVAGGHASIQLKISHLGFSYLTGRFDKFEGSFSYDPNKPEASTVTVSVETASINTNHAERDKHLRSKDFLDVAQFPKANFVSTGFKDNGDGSGQLAGNLTLHGVTKAIQIMVNKIGGGNDPWGNTRLGFTGSTTITMKDYGIMFDLGPASKDVELIFNIEGIAKK